MTPEETEKMLGELETQLERLQALYNQYFMGIERLEPTVQRKEVERKVQALRREAPRNTAQRFRLQTQIQKFNTQSIYWRRICKQIEEGTYKRDIMRAKKLVERAETEERTAHAPADLSIDVSFSELDEIGADVAVRTPAAGTARRPSRPDSLDIDEPFADAGEPAKERGVATLDDPFGEVEAAPAPKPAPEPAKPAPVLPRPAARAPAEAPKRPAGKSVVDDDDLEDIKSFFTHKSVPPPPPKPAAAVQPQQRPAQAAKPQQRPAAAAKPGLSDERLQSIYRAYLTARKRCNEPTDSVSFDKLAQSLRKQADAKSQGVDFKVVIREGKAMIKLVKS